MSPAHKFDGESVKSQRRRRYTLSKCVGRVVHLPREGIAAASTPLRSISSGQIVKLGATLHFDHGGGIIFMSAYKRNGESRATTPPEMASTLVWGY